jgi:hypothetical protein
VVIRKKEGSGQGEKGTTGEKGRDKVFKDTGLENLEQNCME